MDGDVVCCICLSSNDITILCKEEAKKYLLTKLQIVGRGSVAKADHLPQSICQACSCELQCAYDLISQYAATCNKFRAVSQYHKNVKEKPTIYNLLEQTKNAKAEQFQKEVQAATNQPLVAEIVVKEEMFSDDEAVVEGFESKSKPCCSKNIYKYKIEAIDVSNDKGRDEIRGLNSDDSNFIGNCSIRLYKGEVKLADEDTVERSDQNMSSNEVNPECKGKTHEPVALEDSNRDDNGYEAGEWGVCNKRLHDDLQASTMLLCEDGTGLKTLEYHKGAKYTKVSKREATTIAPSFSKTKFKVCSKTFVRLKTIDILQENILQTNASVSNKLFKYGERDKNLSDINPLKQPDALHSNRVLQTCDKCGKSFTTERSMKKHQVLHSNPDAFKCEQCNTRFSSKQILRQHEITHSNPELLKCEQCGKSFTTERSMNEHQMLHSNPDAFKCDQCDKRFSSSRNLRQHKITHSNPDLLTCEKCRKSFTTESSMNEHEMLHSNPDAFKCEQCEKRFLSSRKLRQHKIIHSNPELLTCEICGKSFTTEHSMNEHQVLHSNPDAFDCEQCGKRFLNKHNLKSHQIVHLNPDAFKCEQCDKRFSSKNNLDKHKIIHTNPGVLTCEKCGKLFPTERFLNEHHLLHSNPDAFKCEQCNKRFLNKHTLKSHQTLHSNPDAFKCEQCDKRFSSKNNLGKHKIVHSIPRLLSCDKCDKTFPSVYMLRDHQKWHLNPDAFK